MEGRLYLEFMFDDMMRIKTWHFSIRQHRELIPRSILAMHVSDPHPSWLALTPHSHAHVSLSRLTLTSHTRVNHSRLTLTYHYNVSLSDSQSRKPSHSLSHHFLTPS